MLFRLASNWNCLRRCASRAFEGGAARGFAVTSSLLAPLDQVGNGPELPLMRPLASRSREAIFQPRSVLNCLMILTWAPYCPPLSEWTVLWTVRNAETA